MQPRRNSYNADASFLGNIFPVRRRGLGPANAEDEARGTSRRLLRSFSATGLDSFRAFRSSRSALLLPSPRAFAAVIRAAALRQTQLDADA
jgi:hypothetical protein